jgi:hypothetical protein
LARSLENGAEQPLQDGFREMLSAAFENFRAAAVVPGPVATGPIDTGRWRSDAAHPAAAIVNPAAPPSFHTNWFVTAAIFHPKRQR